MRLLTSPAVFCFTVFALGAAALGAPRIDDISLRGLQSGAKTTVTLSGAELLPEPRLWLGDQPIAAALKGSGASERIELEIELPPDSFPGIRLLRIANGQGISNAVAVVVDELVQSPLTSEAVSVPIAITGRCDGATRVIVPFDGQAGAMFAVEVEAKRLGSPLNPVIHLLDENGAQLAWAQGVSQFDGDARLTATLPRDGRYRIELHDALFQGQPPAFFRLKLANAAIETVPFLRGMTEQELLARSLTGLIGERVNTGAWHPVRLALPSTAPTGLLRMYVSPWREVTEEVDSELAGTMTAPVGINGRLLSPGEVDAFRVAVTPGTKLKIECWAERANSPLDGVLTIHDPQGNQLSVADDQSGTTDPGLEFDVPAQIASIELRLRDLRHRGGEAFRYRLEVVPVDQPELRVTFDADRYVVPVGGAAIARVHADRRSYGGPIALAFNSLPTGMVAEQALLPAGVNDALMSLHGAEPNAAGVVHVQASTVDAPETVTRTVTGPANAVSGYSPWLAGEFAIATAPAAPLTVAWGAPLETDALTLAGTTALPAQIQRTEGVAGAVRLSLITSQVPPTKMENNQTVPDVDRTLRLAQEAVLAADQVDATVTLAVPADLPDLPHDVALKAELLGGDGNQVLATAYSAVRRLPVRKPTFQLRLAGAAEIVPTADGQMAVELRGTVERSPGFGRAVTVKLEGLPTPATVVVAEGQTEFSLTVPLPAALPLAELRNLKLTAASELAPQVFVPAMNELPLKVRLGGEG
ncbi:MAG: hypothetical protein SGJ19_29305 [Planctomycetia bacterium]|nr:hypothetical protein [Planctomycetia bacterium]